MDPKFKNKRALLSVCMFRKHDITYTINSYIFSSIMFCISNCSRYERNDSGDIEQTLKNECNSEMLCVAFHIKSIVYIDRHCNVPRLINN